MTKNESRTMDEKMLRDLITEAELQDIENTLRQVKEPPTSLPVTGIDLRYPPKSHQIHAYTPQLRAGEPRKLATFYNAGSGGGPLARTLELAVRYLDLLPVAVRLLRERDEATDAPIRKG